MSEQKEDSTQTTKTHFVVRVFGWQHNIERCTVSASICFCVSVLTCSSRNSSRLSLSFSLPLSTICRMPSMSSSESSLLQTEANSSGLADPASDRASDRACRKNCSFFSSSMPDDDGGRGDSSMRRSINSSPSVFSACPVENARSAETSVSFSSPRTSLKMSSSPSEEATVVGSGSSTCCCERKILVLVPFGTNNDILRWVIGEKPDTIVCKQQPRTRRYSWSAIFGGGC